MSWWKSWVVAVLVVAWAVCPTAAGAEEWQAGAARVKITPRQPMWMSGYGGRKTPSQGTDTDLWAKALVLQDSRGNRIALITLDLVGIPRDISLKVCAALKEHHKLERSQIALCCSHTHSGPVVGTNLLAMWDLDATQLQLIHDYSLELQSNLLAVVDDAVSKLQPARISWANGRTTFAVNRRTNKEVEVPQLRSQGKLVGPVDYDVPVLTARKPDGQVFAIVFGYACHSTVVDFMKWSGDYPAYAQMDLEKMYPDAVAMFFAGCGADQNPLPRRKIEISQQYGQQLAVAVDQTIKGVMQPVSGELTSVYQEISLPFDKLPTKEELTAATESKSPYEARRAKALLKQIEGGTPLSPTYPYPVQLWKIGADLQWITLGGEVVVDYSLRLKRELGPTKTWVAGYTNDVMAYIPSARVLKEGGYEGGGAMVYYGLPTLWGSEVENVLVNGVHQLLKP